MNESEKSKIVSWIEDTMKEEGFSKPVVYLEGTNEKGEGYAADFIFAEVTGNDQNNIEKKVYLAIKMGKSSENLRNSLPMMREVYKRELYVYSNIFPMFHKFQLERNITEIFDAYPRCYKTILTENSEVLVLENLKKRGFVLHYSRKPMNLQHIHLVLKNYAKLHALSLAMRDQSKKEFDELTSNCTSLMKEFLPTGMFRKKDKVVEHLRRGEREDLVEKYKYEIRRTKETIVLEILNDVVEESVLLHGDCHNNNFLFKYKENDEENPLSVAIIDWQTSSLHSPVMDVAFFLYACASGECFSRLEELLEFYHSHLADFVRKLGSDVEKLFSYDTLMNHWKKYSVFGFIVITNFLEMLYVEKEDAPAFENIQEQSDMARFMEEIKLKDEHLYRERLITIIDHHCNLSLK